MTSVREIVPARPAPARRLLFLVLPGGQSVLGLLDRPFADHLVLGGLAAVLLGSAARTSPASRAAA